MRPPTVEHDSLLNSVQYKQDPRVSARGSRNRVRRPRRAGRRGLARSRAVLRAPSVHTLQGMPSAGRDRGRDRPQADRLVPTATESHSTSTFLSRPTQSNRSSILRPGLRTPGDDRRPRPRNCRIAHRPRWSQAIRIGDHNQHDARRARRPPSRLSSIGQRACRTHTLQGLQSPAKSTAANASTSRPIP